ncbi:MAG TPA: response regulator transcription factor [Candidatus Sulfotelmatobacter sp.]|nr:response regulator transcription factor [Candidatus Sulfotelmatobacter sp.]
MDEKPILVLVVEDFGPFREFVRSSLQTALPLAEIFEACDGLRGVSMVQQLRPDLIVLDIGLPELNGLEAARRIREIAPQSKILFLTQEKSPEVVREAFRIGACCYVVKTDAAGELDKAVLAAMRGTRYLSRSASHLED